MAEKQIRPEVATQAFKMAMQKFKEEYGEDARVGEGDDFVTVFNDCTLIISLHGGRLRPIFLDGKPYEVDMTLGVYEKKNGQED